MGIEREAIIPTGFTRGSGDYPIGATIDKGGNVFGYDFIESGENSVLKEGIVDFDKIIEYNENRLSENEKASIFTDSIEAYNYYEF